MAVFRIERTRDYTVMSNHHLRNANLSLKAKGLLSMMLSLPEDWNYTCLLYTSKYFRIPYRTVTEWELDNRHAPEYVLRLLEYYIQNEGLAKKKVTDECSEMEERGGLHEKN